VVAEVEKEVVEVAGEIIIISSSNNTTKLVFRVVNTSSKMMAITRTTRVAMSAVAECKEAGAIKDQTATRHSITAAEAVAVEADEEAVATEEAEEAGIASSQVRAILLLSAFCAHWDYSL
jgi:GTP:adenosylcobinamide-phosphate guanylyltransferase